jgi:two-component system, NtrC family, sensor histidine kinase HydH
MMAVKRYDSLYLPALIIVAAVLILLFVIAYSTYRTMDRESARMEEALRREARIIITAIEAAVQGDPSPDTPDLRRLNTLLEDISRNPDIAGISLIDPAGRLVAYSSPIEKKRDLRGGASLNLLLTEKGMIGRYGHDPAGGRTFEIIQPLRKFPLPNPPLALRRKTGEGAVSKEKNSPVHWSHGMIAAVSFRLQVFDTAREEDFRHVILMGAILIILGTGTIYFIFIVQKYYRDLREIHELKERVRRSEHLASLGRLAAGMAHEIRNPLSSIRGFAQFFLNRFQGKKEEQEYASIMVKEVDRLNRVISELLDFAHPRQLRREPCHLAGILDYALKVLALELEKKKVVVEKHYAEDLPLVPADQEQLSQAFLNLLLNALEAIEEEGRIIIGLQKDSGRDMMNITLTDNGRGIPPEDLEKIFEPFFSTKRKGNGLGLAIVNQIVENHGGEIWAENRQGGGTVFTIVLPLFI